MLIPIGNEGQLIQLGDITTITKGYKDPPTQMVKVNGKDAITLHVNLKKNENIVALGKEIDRVMKDWEKRLPVGLELTRVSALDHFIDAKVSGFIENLIQSVTIVLLVMLIFLGVRTGLVIASLIPIVIITTLMTMGLIDMGSNQVTLAALIMALGMLVDNAIVVSESMMVKMEDGDSPLKAAIDASTELMIPLLVSSLTTSAAFLAFFFPIQPSQ